MARVAAFVLLLASAVFCAASAQTTCAELKESFQLALDRARASGTPDLRHLFDLSPGDIGALTGGPNSVCEHQCIDSEGVETYFSCCENTAAQIIQPNVPQPTPADEPLLSLAQFPAFCIPSFAPAPPTAPVTQDTTTEERPVPTEERPPVPATEPTTVEPPVTTEEPTTAEPPVTTEEPTTATEASTQATTASAPDDSCPSLALSSKSRFLRQSRNKVCQYTCSFRVSVHGIPAGTRTRSYYSCCDGSQPTVASRALRLYRC